MTFDEALNDEYCLKILNLLHRWLPKLPKEELKQLQMIALWEATSTFDTNKKCKFTTHLYNRVRFKFLKHINKKSNSFLPKTEETPFATKVLNLDIFFDGLSANSREILEDRFVNKLSLQEMSKKYNLKRKELTSLIETAKKEFEKLL